jgi:hypothetical protein
MQAEFFLSVTDAGKSLMYAKSPLEIVETVDWTGTPPIQKHLHCRNDGKVHGLCEAITMNL